MVPPDQFVGGDHFCQNKGIKINVFSTVWGNITFAINGLTDHKNNSEKYDIESYSC